MRLGDSARCLTHVMLGGDAISLLEIVALFDLVES